MKPYGLTDETPGVSGPHRLLAAHLVGDPAARAMYNGDPSVMLHFSAERATSARVTSTIFDINRRAFLAIASHMDK